MNATRVKFTWKERSFLAFDAYKLSQLNWKLHKR